ncbi:MAG: hypothetical protein ABI678_02990 [Kofleriaceae bacterium]
MSWSYRLAGLLRYAALQFLVLTPVAMTLYAGGTWFDPGTLHYRFTENFLSDLGMTHAFSGRSNTAAAVVFSIALATIGLALVAFAWTWRSFAFGLRRARWVGHASAVLGTLSGLCFTGVACTPFDLALDAHNTFVIAAFGLLMLYVATITIVMWRNGIAGARFAANFAYLALVAGYVVLVLTGPRMTTPHGHTVQVIGQKVVAYGSMLHVLYLATSTRRALQ